MNITVCYKRIGESNPVKFEVAPEDYFVNPCSGWPDLMADWEHGVPLHDHAIELLGQKAEDVEWTKVTIEDPDNDLGVEITETFWNGGLNRVIERVDAGKSPYWEMIIVSAVQPNSTEIVRLIRQDGRVTPVYHGVIVDNPDGSETERRFPLPSSRDEKECG